MNNTKDAAKLAGLTPYKFRLIEEELRQRSVRIIKERGLDGVLESHEVLWYVGQLLIEGIPISNDL